MSEKERLQIENELLMTCSKAQAINKYIDELEENSKLSELWCKSQQENSQLKDNWNKLKEIVKSQSDFKLKVRNKELWFEVDELLSKMEELEKGDNKIISLTVPDYELAIKINELIDVVNELKEKSE